QHRDSGLRRAGAERLQRALRVHLLSSAAAVQPRRPLPGGETAAGQCPQCRGLGRIAAARDRVPTATRQRGGLPRRRGLCQDIGDQKGNSGLACERRVWPSMNEKRSELNCVRSSVGTIFTFKRRTSNVTLTPLRLRPHTPALFFLRSLPVQQRQLEKQRPKT